MARQKSEQVRVAIMGAAERLFMEKGYIATTINSIARAAGTSQSNVYVYFDSKFEIAFAVFDPWLQTRVIGGSSLIYAQIVKEFPNASRFTPSPAWSGPKRRARQGCIR